MGIGFRVQGFRGPEGFLQTLRQGSLGPGGRAGILCAGMHVGGEGEECLWVCNSLYECACACGCECVFDTMGSRPGPPAALHRHGPLLVPPCKKSVCPCVPSCMPVHGLALPTC